MCPGCCLGGNLDIASTKTFSNMDACCSRFTAPEGGARLAMVAAEKNTLAVEYSAFVSTRLLHEDAYKIRGLLSKGYQRSVYITRASRVAYVAYELHILTDLVAAKALEYSDEEDWQLVLEEKQVLVCTSQVIKMILQEGVLSIPQINVLIIDSCHLIFEDPHLQYVMNCYKKCPESEQPRILALTYPLFTSGKDSDVQTDNSVNNTSDKDENTATSNNEADSKVKVEQADEHESVTITDSNAKTPAELVQVSESEQKPENKCNDDGGSQKMVDYVDKKNVKVSGELEKVDEIIENGADSSDKDISLDSDKINALKDDRKGETEETVDTLNNSKKEIENSDKEAENKQLKDETKDKDDITEKSIENTSIETNHNQKTEISKDKAKDSKKTDCEAKEKNMNPKDEIENAETDVEKIRKDKKHVKSADLVVCPKENYDDFDMYCKLEWKIEQLEEALCCKMDLAEDIDGGKRLANTIAKPKELLIEYSPKVSSGTKSEVYEELENYMREEVASAVAFMDEHRYDPSEIYGDELYEEFMNIPDPTIEPKLMFNQFLYVLDQLGPFAADKAAFSLLVKLEKLKIKVPYERHFLLLCLCTSVFVKIRCYADLIMSKYDDWEKIRMFSTPKVLRFAEILEQFQTPEHMSKANGEIKESIEVDSRNNAEEDRNTAKENNLEVSESNDFNKNDSENESRETLHNNMQCESRSNEKSTKNHEDFGDRRIVELETILGNARNSDNNKNTKDCTIAIYKSNPNLIDSSIEDKLVIDSEKHFLEQSDSSNSKRNDNNVETKSQNNTVSSKTTKLLDEIEKCDFVTLGNKIEDRVNTYEANLKDLDDVSYTAEKIVNPTDKNDAEIEKDESESSRKVKVESNKDRTKLKDNTTHSFDNIKNLANKEANMEEISENITEYSDNNKTDSHVEVDSKAGTMKGENMKIDAINTKTDILDDKTDTVIAKTDVLDDKTEKNDTCIEKETIVEAKQNVLELRHKPPGLRRPHRVRGRGRVHRSHAARLQQMQQNPDALCGIVFMREPLVAKIMFMIIADMSRSRPSLSHLCAQYCAVETDGDDSRPQGKKHEEVLKKFRMHECNLLLATPALEEGIDLPRCNLVVRWDLPHSYRSHGLCRSRARAPRSSLALMAEAHTTSEELLDNLSVYKELDQIISRKCGCGIQNEPPAAEEVHADIFTSVIKPYTPVDEKDRQTDKINKEIVKDNHENISEDKISLLTEENRQGNVDKNIIKEKEDVLKVILEENDGSVKKNTAIQMKMVEDGDNNNEAQINDGIALSGVEKNDTENDESNNSNKVDRLIIKECVDGITKEVIRTEVIIKQIDKDGVVKIKTDSKNSEISEALNELDKDTIDKLDENIPIDRESVNKDFNITYDLSKSVCDCKGVCKCNLSVNGAKSKADKKSEEGLCSVDLSSAIALINRYCGKLPSDTFTRLAPQYWMEEVQLPDKRTGELRTAYICTLRLPLNCPVKYNIVGHPMPTRVLARRMVALQACRILHKSGELDNQLMPIGKENFKAAELESTTHSDNENNDSARPGTTKRRQYYYKRTASAFTDCQPLVDSTDAEIEQQSWQEAKESYRARFPPDTKRNTLFALSSRLWCALPERYNTRGRRLHAPQNAPHAQAVLMATCDPHGLQIPAFPVYTRSGEVRVSIEPALQADVRLSPRRARLVRRFMRFVFSDVLRVRRRGMRLQAEGSTHNNYYIVPTIRVNNEDGTSHVDIDWSFLELIYQHTEEKKISAEKPLLLQQDGEEDEGEVEDREREKRAPKREREKDGKVKQMENPFLKPGEVFVFVPEKYRDAVVTPWYRNRDQPQYFLVAEICWNLSPDSAFPSVSHGSFRDYYMSKYGVTLTQPHQPLLDVDHTSARLNLLTPRYVNRKGVALPVSSERTRRAKRDRLDQKQILVPELCTVHPFAAPLWFATVALPCVLYRINALLIADEIRRSVSADVALGAPPIRGVPPPQWPPLDFGWSLAEVLNTDEKGEKGERKKEEDDSRKGQKEIQDNQEKESSKEETSAEEKESGKEGDGEGKTEVKEKTINDILQEKEDAESGFEIGTWSNEMASSIPQEYDEFMEPLPSNLTFCTSASGGANWSDAIPKTKGTFGASKAFSMAESDCSYLSSDFDTDDSDLNSEGSDEDMDSGGFGSKNYAAMGVRIEYKTAHEAEAVDLERKAKASNAPQPDPEDDARDLVCQRRMLREGRPPDEYIEKYNNSVIKHKEDIKSSRLIADKEPIKEILPDTAKEMDILREQLANKLKKNKLTDITKHVLRTGKILDENNIIENELISDNSKTDENNAIENELISDNSKTDENNVIENELISDNSKTDENNVIENELTSDNSKTDSSNEINVSKTIEASDTNCVDSKELSNDSDSHKNLEVRLDQKTVKVNDTFATIEEEGNVKSIVVKTERNSASIKLNLTNDFTENDTVKINTTTQFTIVSDVESPKDKINVTNEKDIKSELLDEIFPYGDALDIQNGHVTLESIEKNKRIILNKFKASLTKEEINKFNCFSMLDIDIDSPDYVNEKVVNVGFDTKENYVDKVNSFRNPTEYTPYYYDNKGQNGKEFNFDYQPDLEGHPGPSPSVILQALTMSNANDGINLERLETIGDSFLKFAITAYLYCAHPAVHEGKLSHMRSKQVSNLNLYRLGRNKRLGARMIASKFEPHDNWLPPCHKPPPTHHPTSGDQEIQMQKDAATDNTGCFIPYNLITQHSIPDKSIADCVEALIGAYLLECGPRGALLFMAWLGIGVLPRHVLPLPPDHPCVVGGEGRQKPPTPPSPKQSYSSSSAYSSDTESPSSESEWEGEGEEEREGVEGECWYARPAGSLRPRRDENGRWTQTIFGELRAPPSPLLRYVEDPEGELERMLSGYDALERTLQYRFRDRSLLLQALTHASHHQNRLTDCYQRLEFLGDAILDYLITRHLYEDARRHSPGALTDLRSALVNNTIFATLAARHGFHKYFRHMSPGLNEVLTKYVKIQEENGHSISEEHYLIQEDEMEQAEDVEVPKALGDLFESVAGAIFLDSGMSLSAVWKSYVRLMGAELEAFSAAAPKSPVRELLEAEPDTAKFGKPERLADGRRVRVCVEVFGRGAFKGIGRNYRIAKGTAARCALRHLRGARPERA